MAIAAVAHSTELNAVKIRFVRGFMQNLPIFRNLFLRSYIHGKYTSNTGTHHDITATTNVQFGDAWLPPCFFFFKEESASWSCLKLIMYTCIVFYFDRNDGCHHADRQQCQSELGDVRPDFDHIESFHGTSVSAIGGVVRCSHEVEKKRKENKETKQFLKANILQIKTPKTHFPFLYFKKVR